MSRPAPDLSPDEVWRRRRETMVRDQIERRGIEDEAVLRAMRLVPRHRFVPHDLRHAAYDDAALAIGDGQTISQPYMVALMTELLELDQETRLLELGTGSGYQAAVASRICRQVWSVERHEALSQRAAEVLGELGYENVRLFVGDGSRGLPSEAPFDAIVVTAAAPQVPQALLEQLADGGRLVAPLGGLDDVQTLMVYERQGDAYERHASVGCRFVPLIEGPAPARQGDDRQDGTATEDGDDRY
jgi:protein-L-isoaspartate(D-aspartate) O-methyltransferase